jgi:hypothetical protein
MGALPRVRRPRFVTISDADWARELRLARATPNQIRAKIRARVQRLSTRADV